MLSLPRFGHFPAKESGCWKIGRACGNAAGFSPPRPPQPSWVLLICRATLCRATLCRATLCRATLCPAFGVVWQENRATPPEKGPVAQPTSQPLKRVSRFKLSLGRCRGTGGCRNYTVACRAAVGHLENTATMEKSVNDYAVVFLLRPPFSLRLEPFFERKDACDCKFTTHSRIFYA